MLAYGYKPSDLVQISALDVVDIVTGLRQRLDNEIKIMYNAAEMAGMLATGKYRRSSSGPERTTYSDKIRKMIAEQDKKDLSTGKIKVNG